MKFSASASSLHMAALRIGSFIWTHSSCDDLGQTSFHSPLPHRCHRNKGRSPLASCLKSLAGWNHSMWCLSHNNAAEEHLTVSQRFMQLLKPWQCKLRQIDCQEVTIITKWVKKNNKLQFIINTNTTLHKSAFTAGKFHCLWVGLSYTMSGTKKWSINVLWKVRTL